MPGLIEAPAQIWLAVTPVDMRRGWDGLSAIVQQSLGHSPCAGSAFIFRSRAGNRHASDHATARHHAVVQSTCGE